MVHTVSLKCCEGESDSMARFVGENEVSLICKDPFRLLLVNYTLLTTPELGVGAL
jgi:hypothetical protein